MHIVPVDPYQKGSAKAVLFQSSSLLVMTGLYCTISTNDLQVVAGVLVLGDSG